MKDISCNRLALLAFCASLGNSIHFKDGNARNNDSALPSSRHINGENNEHATVEMEKGSRRISNEFSDEDVEFSFSCSSLSLEESIPKMNTIGNWSLDPLPSFLMSRPLTGNSYQHVQSASEAITCNIFKTFQKSIEWRKHHWIESLSQSLRATERKMKQCGTSDTELKSLIKTPPALLISCLKQSNIKVLAARTFFRVLPNLWDKNDNGPKRRDYSKYPTYVLTFKTVLNISTPSGYSEVTLEAPGTIQGAFSSFPSREKELTNVDIVVDTRVLANIIEKSNRILVRTAVESLLPIIKKNRIEVELFPDVCQSPQVSNAITISQSPKQDHGCSLAKIPP